MGDFDESEHPRDGDGKFTDGNGQSQKTADAIRKYSDDPARDMEYGNLPSAKRIADRVPQSAWENGKNKNQPKLHIDFERDNVLPELNSDTLKKLGTKESKKVLLKKSVIDRNFQEHADLTRQDFESIIYQALYDEPEVFPANADKPNYYHLASLVETNSKGKPEVGIVLLDIDAQKDDFEIVHAHYVRKRSYERLKNKQ